MKVGDIVKVKRGMMIVVDNKRMCISAEDRFVVIDATEHNMVLKYVALGSLDKFAHRVEFLIDRSSVEVVDDKKKPKPRHSSSKVNFNPTPKLNKQDMLALIDLALDTGDKQWFDELHSKLSALA